MTKDGLRKWRYYFLDLPLFSCGLRSSSLEKRLYRMYEPEIGFMRNGFMTLCDYLKRPLSEPEIEDFVRKTFWVKVVRESDAYTSLRMSKKNLARYFRAEKRLSPLAYRKTFGTRSVESPVSQIGDFLPQVGVVR